MEKKDINIAVIDLYNGEPNQGMRCIQDHLYEKQCKYQNLAINYDIYESRLKGDVPDFDKYDIYISSGGPGSPFSDEGTAWENSYFDLLDKVWNHNQKSDEKKYIFFICHSFQIMSRFFQLGDVVQRDRKSFGIVPVNLTPEGMNDAIFSHLSDPFYGADFRGWQVINQNKSRFEELGAKLLALEYDRPELRLERAMMAIRISDEIIGTQFHPEADPPSMYYHFRQAERKQQVVDEYGEEAYYEMINHLENPENINLTKKTVLPGFLRYAIEELSQTHTV